MKQVTYIHKFPITTIMKVQFYLSIRPIYVHYWQTMPHTTLRERNELEPSLF